MQTQSQFETHRQITSIGTLGIFLCLFLAGTFTPSLAQGQNANTSWGNRRAALNQWANPTSISPSAKTTVDTAGESRLRGDLSRGGFERREGGNPRFCERDFGQPFGDPKEIERHRRENLLQVRFD